MPSIDELRPFLTEPREDLGVEYKEWLDLTTNEHRAILAKAAIALANHGGGFIIIGMSEVGGALISVARPGNIDEPTQDGVNAAIRRFATPEFHCELYSVDHPETGNAHPIISVPGTVAEPVMSKRDCAGVIAQNRCYIRKPGPRSEEPQTAEEWRTLINRCIRVAREDMLDAIRSIVSGQASAPLAGRDVMAELMDFAADARLRWEELTKDEPENSPAVFPHGHYEMAFSLVDAVPCANLGELQVRLDTARAIRLTGWVPFLRMTTPGWSPYPHQNFIEAWVGRPVRPDHMEREPAHCDFWRASLDGKLFTIRGYAEDGLEGRPPGELFDITLPVWRVGEALLFAARLAATFEEVTSIAIWCRFTGLDGRRMVSVSGMRAAFGDDVSHTDEVALSATATIAQVQDNLPEVLHGLLRPLYERFDFFVLPMLLVQQELDRMRSGRFELRSA